MTQSNQPPSDAVTDATITKEVALTPAAQASANKAQRALEMQVRSVDVHLMRDTHAAVLGLKSYRSTALILLMTAAIGGFIYWAHESELEEVTRGNAKVIASRGEQKLNSQEGGILTEMSVREGDTVQAGQVLAKLDPTRANSSFFESDAKRIALKATAVRLRAEGSGTGLNFGPEFKAYASITASERSAFLARQTAVEQSVASLRLNQKNLEREVAMLRPLVKEGAVSVVETMRIERQLGELAAQIADRINKARADANIELIKVESELSQLGENIKARADVLERTSIKAPMKAVVKNIRHSTIGSVIQPADVIMELVPLEDSLQIEARIRPSDVAFLRPGLPVVVKISAYDYTIYGSLKGTLKFISPDTLKDEKRAGIPGEDDTYYRVLITTPDTGLLSPAGKKLDITPGMTASVDILTGKRTVMDYLLKPLMRYQEALRER